MFSIKITKVFREIVKKIGDKSEILINVSIKKLTFPCFFFVVVVVVLIKKVVLKTFYGFNLLLQLTTVSVVCSLQND